MNLLSCRRFLSVGFLLSLIVTPIYSHASRGGIFELPMEATAFTTKQVCSCLFITGLGEPFCRNFARQRLRVRIHIDYERKRVVGRALGAVAHAHFGGSAVGCVLD